MKDLSPDGHHCEQCGNWVREFAKFWGKLLTVSKG